MLEDERRTFWILIACIFLCGLLWAFALTTSVH